MNIFIKIEIKNFLGSRLHASIGNTTFVGLMTKMGTENKVYVIAKKE